MSKFVRLLLLFLILATCLPLSAAAADPTGTVYVRIETTDGSPVPRVYLDIVSLIQNVGNVYPEYSGTFPITLGVGPHKISVSAVGYATVPSQMVTLTAGQTQNVTFSLTRAPGPGKITGRVTDKSTGAPASGVRVSLAQDGAIGVPVQTDWTGDFTFPAVAPGTYKVSTGFGLSSPNTYDFVEQTQEVTVTPGGTVRADFSLVRQGQIVAIVKNRDGSLIKDATVTLSPGSSPNYRFIIGPDLYGRNQAFVAPDTYRVIARGLGLAEPEPQTVTVTSGQTQIVTFELAPVPSGTLQGKVTDRNGTPVPFATVAIYDQEMNQVRSVLTGADGQFTFANLAQGTHVIHASATGFTLQPITHGGPDSGASRRVTVEAGKTTNSELTLTRNVLTKVRVVDADGKLVPGGFLVRDDHQLRTETDSDGTLLLTAPEGEVRAAAEAPGYPRTAERTFHVGAPGDPALVTFTLSKSPVGKITGKTVDRLTGKPAAGLHVHLRDRTGAAVRLPVLSGPDGTFALEGVPVGTYELYGYLPDYYTETASVTVTENATVTVELKTTAYGTLDIHVVDGSGKPVPNAQVFVTGPAGLPDTAVTDSDGSYRMGLEVATYQLTAQAGYTWTHSVRTVQVEQGKVSDVALVVTDDLLQQALKHARTFVMEFLWPAFR